jgi:adenosylmethionine-8-amino-7-oxononanoate aminotransferase
MKNSFFVTGTDTDVGKTIVSGLLLKVLSKKEMDSNYYKPVQTGEETDTNFLRDVLGEEDINFYPETYHYPKPISPDRAARSEAETISLAKIVEDFSTYKQDLLVVEGAGGIMVPINHHENMASLAKKLDLPIIIVARTALGTINHTLMTIKVAQSMGLTIAGIVLNGHEDPGLKELLIEKGNVPVIGEVPFIDSKNLGELFNNPEHFFCTSFLKSLDQSPIWYPFTQHSLKSEHVEVSSAQGALLKLSNGKTVIDGISSWWVNNHGHCHPEIVRNISEQAYKLDHCILSGLTHKPATDLAFELIKLANKSRQIFDQVFFSDNGSTSVEVALKMAYQYFQNIGQPRTKFLSLKGAYHGDTVGAMSVSDPSGFHRNFKELFFPVDFVDPMNPTTLSEFAQSGQEYCAFIVEPLIQGAFGMRMYDHSFLNQVRSFCDEHGILFIFDEVFTGFGRLGENFAFERADVVPDILCLSKGITGGTLSLGATLVRDKVFKSFLSCSGGTTFLHGHSYTGNPISASAALASIKILQSEQSVQNRQNLSQWTAHRIDQLKANKFVMGARSLGTIGALELSFGKEGYENGFSYEFAREALERGVLLRPLGNTVYTVPPFCITNEEFHKIYDVIEELIHEFS